MGEMVAPEIRSAAEAMEYIQTHIAVGLTPVMKGTRFYRHSFSISQFGSYLYYLDERGTAGRCQYQNLFRTFDFIFLGLPVPGSEPWQEVPEREPHLGHVLVIGTIPGDVPAPSLLAAAAVALAAMDEAGIAGPVRDDLEQAILAERRTN